ncbi:MAG: NAD(P)-binding domain-containing protein [Rickettsiales bacterium]|jgi:L-lactate dehydrogenase|nr:NAD(P)-binding domain-containing protein [Rickettsiales bacterium]
MDKWTNGQMDSKQAKCPFVHLTLCPYQIKDKKMKIGIIGLGSVGSAIATAVHNTGIVRQMVLFDRDELRARAAAEDLGHAGTFNFNTEIRSGGYRELRGSDIVIIAAGANQKPGQTRTDLLQANAAVIRDIIPQVMKNADVAKLVLIIVTNPLDPMVMLASELSGLPAGRVIGTGTMLDSARLRVILARQFGVSPASVNAFVLGEHGDSSVLNWTSASVGGLPLDDFAKQTKNTLTAAARKTIEHRVHNAAYEIIQGRGATWDGIGAAAADLVRCIANDERRILTVSCLDRGAAVSLPRIVGIKGATAGLNPKMNASESAALKKSIAIVKKNFSNL